MPAPAFPRVLLTSEARVELSQTLERFRQDGITAEPLVFGSYRRPEGVVIPFALYEALLPVIEDIEIAAVVRERLAGPEQPRPGSQLLSDLGFTEADLDLT